MKFNSQYMQQVDLLLDVLPILNHFTCFALKGGTAINLFLRNLNARNQLVHTILKDLTHNERQFLLSVKQGEPDWSLMQIPGIDNLPALQWKILNIRKMDKTKRQNLFEKLQRILAP